MNDDSHASADYVVAAAHLQKPTLPHPYSNTPNSSRATSWKTSATDSRAPSDAHLQEQTETIQPHPRPSPNLSRTGTGSAPASRPPIQTSSTERPRPTMRSSLLGRKRAGTGDRPQKLGRQATLTFDLDTDESSSSDEDETPTHGHVDGPAEAKPKKPRQQKQPRSGSPDHFSRFKMANEHFNTKGRVSKMDGRLKLSINETVNSGYFAKTLGAGLKKHFKGGDDVDSARSPTGGPSTDLEKIAPENDDMEDPERRVRLNIVVIVIGSRGDIQPFLRIGKILKEDYGHRVRIATHPAFKKFVEQDSGLEFFSVGGNPAELMAFMVKNPGLIPSVDTIKEGEIGRRRSAMYEMFQGMWRACINATDDENDKDNLKMMGNRQPFVADAIIANPPSFAPPHIAERLGIPLHMMFTFPYSPTVQFPHPLANIKASNVDANYTNFMSYPLVEMMTWQGLGDLINRFRAKTLCLEEVSTLWAPGQLYRLRVPYTYMWSPSLVPKPKDWGPEIDIAGFVFLDLASSFKPPEDLTKFLVAGPPPIYIGFGSIVVDDPDQFTKLIFEAVELAGVRALVSKGWGGFGSNADSPDSIFMLENTPHDWLFPRVSAVVHHGGAGTTAAGLKCARPTMIVPFFGDQPFWGAMLAKAKAGAHECIPYKKLTVERLAEGIKECLTEEAKENVQKIADGIAAEGDGALNAVRSFHRSLPLQGKDGMRCHILNNRIANWRLKGTDLHLSPLAAGLLVDWKKIKWNELRLLRHCEWNDFGGPGEPITGAWGAIIGTAGDIATGIGSVPVKMARSVKKHEKYYEKRYKIKKREKHAKETLAKTNGTNGTADSATNGHVDAAKLRNGRPAAPERLDTTLSKLSEPEDYLAEDLAQDAGHGFKKTGVAILKAPMRFTLAVTQGFHNAPRLYGDESVRRPPRITGLHSGLRAGRDELVHGVHDGVTGIWKHPYYGAKDGGVLGCFRGVGMGIGGFFLKDIAAFLGPGAYFMKGLNEEHKKKHQPTNFLRRARMIQGQNDLAELERQSGSDRDDDNDAALKRQELENEISTKWKAMQPQVLAEKQQHRTGVRAALLGKSQRKEGKAIPRKTTAPANPPNGTTTIAAASDPPDTTPTPTIEADKFQQPTSTIPAPATPPQHHHQHQTQNPQTETYTLGSPSRGVRQEGRLEGGMRSSVPSVFAASLEGNGGLVGGHKMQVLEEEDARTGAAERGVRAEQGSLVGGVDGRV